VSTVLPSRPAGQPASRTPRRSRPPRWTPALVALAVLPVAGCGSHDSPRKVTEAYLRAFRAGDAPAVDRLVCARDRGGPVFSSDQDKASAASFAWRIGRERVHGKTAEVDFVLRRSVPTTQTRSETALLVSEHGDWRVCGLRGRR
jgi:hypothetical protein